MYDIDILNEAGELAITRFVDMMREVIQYVSGENYEAPGMMPMLTSG